MKNEPATPERDLLEEIEQLRARLDESNEMLDAIRRGDLDGVLLANAHGRQLVALDEADSVYRELVERMSEAAITLSGEGVILYANRCLGDMLGAPLEELIGSPIRAWVGENEASVIEALLGGDAGGRRREELSFVRQDGQAVPVLVSVAPVELEEHPAEYQMVATDLTEQKRNRAVAEAERLARAIFEQASEAIVVADEQGHIVRASHVANNLCDHNPVGLPFEQAFPIAGEQGRTLTWTNMSRLGRAIHYGELTCDDKGISLQVSRGPLCDADGNEVGSVVIMTNITKRRLAEGEAQRARADLERELEKTNRARRALLSVIEDQKQAEDILRENEARFRLALENAPISVFNQDSELRYTWIYDARSNYTTETIQGKTDADLFAPEEARQLSEIKQRVLDTGSTRREEVQVTVEGERLEYDLVVEPLWDSANTVIGITCAAVDVTDRKRNEEKLKLASKVFEQGGEGIIVTDADNRIVMVNQAFTTVTGYTEEEALGRNPSMLSSGREDREFYRDMWHSINNRGYWQGEIWNRRKDGSIYPQWLTISPRLDGDGEHSGYIGFFTDITQRKQAEDRIHWLAHFDPLTELPNRTLFRDRVTHAMSLAKRKDGQLAMLFIDLDHFKNINDTLGHHAGDELLIQAAKRLRACLRDEDTISRQGGDEFVVLLPAADATGAGNVAQKLLDAFSRPCRFGDYDLVITVSIGIAMYPDNGLDLDSLSKHADIAMYRAKQNGRNTYCFYTPEMQSVSARTLKLDNDIRQALENGEMDLHYQPQVSISDGSVTGVEALLRWQHPELGMISPAEFIPLAESSGQIKPIGYWVLRTALGQLKAWNDSGIGNLTMAVNLSIRQLREPDLVENLEAILQEVGVDPRCVELELTESMLMEDQETVIAMLGKINALGVHLAIDDFGTGFSSLSYLKQLPVDRLKIDKSFVNDMNQKHDDAIIARSIISLGHSLGMKVIAEGVETGEQMEFLRAHHCDELQGYLFSKPLARDDLEPVLRQGQRLERLAEIAGMESKTLLLVDDEPNILRALERVLRHDGYHILSATSAEEGLELLAMNNVDVIVSDQRMPGMSGVEFLNKVKDLYPDTVRIVLSGYTDLKTVTDAINRGDIYKFLTKPWEDNLLRVNIREAFQRHNISSEYQRLARELKAANKELARLQSDGGVPG